MFVRQQVPPPTAHTPVATSHKLTLIKDMATNSQSDTRREAEATVDKILHTLDKCNITVANYHAEDSFAVLQTYLCVF
jgi:hypothetical protein